jgi:hypothetical protein
MMAGVRAILTLVLDELSARRGRTMLLSFAVALALVAYLTALAIGGSNSRGLASTVGEMHGFEGTYRIEGFGDDLAARDVAPTQLHDAYRRLGMHVVTVWELSMPPESCTVPEGARVFQADASIRRFLPEIGPHDTVIELGGADVRCTERERVVTLSENGYSRNLGLSLGDVVMVGSDVSLTSVKQVAVIARAQSPSQLRDPAWVDQVGTTARAVLGTFSAIRGGDPTRISARQVDDVGSFEAAERGSRIVTNAFGLTCLLLSAFAIASVYTATVRSRLGVLGLMRAAGGSRRFVFALVTVEVLAVTATGSLLGIVAAFVVDRPIARFLADSFRQDTTILVGSAVAQGLATMLIAGLLASAVPALRASRLNIIEAIEGS